MLLICALFIVNLLGSPLSAMPVTDPPLGITHMAELQNEDHGPRSSHNLDESDGYTPKPKSKIKRKDQRKVAKPLLEQNAHNL